ncbi:hypothetical protein [Nakamurella lactea]|uniref:hypothetical protein n=1 Tax=Nakamurella lactea TaxID=459515 RepID=UPI000422A854|nr:hypothetical protein [Nakamurella lactea]
MTTLPRFSHAEIRSFADWLIDQGWTYTGDDADGHALFSYPNGAAYKLPETPRYFPVQRNRVAVQKLMGHKVDGKRSAAAARDRQAREALRAREYQQHRDDELSRIVARIDSRDERAQQQIREAADELGCHASVRAIDARRRELMSIAALMGTRIP